MSVRIRLRRVGRKKQPYWRVVVVPRSAPRDGAYIEELGFYNPRTRPAFLTLDLEKVDEWIQNGAEISDSVKSLVRKARKGGDDDVVFTRPGEEAPRLKTAKKPERRPKSTAAGEDMTPTDEVDQPEATAPEAEEPAAEEEAAEEEAEGTAEVTAAVEPADEAEAAPEPTAAQEGAETESEAVEASATETEAEAEEEAEAAAEEETEEEAEAGSAEEVEASAEAEAEAEEDEDEDEDEDEK